MSRKAQQQDWPEAGPQQAGRGHAGRQSRDTQEAGRQQEEAGVQQTGLHTGRQSRDTQEEGLQQGLGWQQEGAEQGESSQHTGVQEKSLQQTGVQQTGLQHAGVQQSSWQGEEGPHRRVRQGAGAQHGGSQQLSWQLSTCQEDPVQALGEQTRLRSLEQTDRVDAAITQVLEQQGSAMLEFCAGSRAGRGCVWQVRGRGAPGQGLLYPSLGCCASPESRPDFLFLVIAGVSADDADWFTSCEMFAAPSPRPCVCLVVARVRKAKPGMQSFRWWRGRWLGVSTPFLLVCLWCEFRSLQVLRTWPRPSSLNEAVLAAGVSPCRLRLQTRAGAPSPAECVRLPWSVPDPVLNSLLISQLPNDVRYSVLSRVCSFIIFF
ncbi:uncharacterized protein LOC123610477 [Leopardus geoffroyi]|uniref:uncharacterized protein LOC123610477 n=1 Tax=Leopardus geoffroyi TaxID=46844 RepID=UPI001E262150|nr:uncharacterized protein LOC123610477 [Leopardus geoffroyi]